jgi:hypothetical protein
MDEILADYNEAELELLAGFLQKVTAAGVDLRSCGGETGFFVIEDAA